MALDPLQSWDQVGRRVASARQGVGLTRAALARDASLDEETLAQIEAGQHALSAAELSRLATALEQPLDWFLSKSPPSVVSLRADRLEGPQMSRLDMLLENAARDVELLQELGMLTSVPDVTQWSLRRDIQDAEHAAQRARQEAGWPHDHAVHDLNALAEHLGLYAFALDFDDGEPDGAYVSLANGGVAVINGSLPPGRRRFTLAHELGHHVFQDEYSTDWAGSGTSGDSERLMDAFAVDLLLPRAAVIRRWNELRAADGVEPRPIAVQLAAEMRVSWSVLCAQLQRFQLIDAATHEDLVSSPPSRADYLERGIGFGEELVSPSVPPKFAASVLSAYRKHKLGASRAIEMLRGVLGANELPSRDAVPRDAFLSDLEPAS